MTKTTVILPDPVAKTLKIFVADNLENMRSQSAVVTKALEEFFQTRGVPIHSKKSLPSDTWPLPQKNIQNLVVKSNPARIDNTEKSRADTDPLLIEVENATKKALGRELTVEESFIAAYIAAVLMAFREQAGYPKPTPKRT